MAGLSNFPGGFPNGITVRGLPILQAQPGQAFWVGNSSNFTPGCVGGADGNPGTYQKPFATVQHALDMCRDGTGDIILIKPGHLETIADATTLILNKDGVSIIGLGSGLGGNRPSFNFTATTSNIPVTADQVSIQNCNFYAKIADVVSTFTATSTNLALDLAIENCAFFDTTTPGAYNFIAHLTGNVTAGCLSGLYFKGNYIYSLGTTVATTSIKLGADSANIQILNNLGVYAVLNDTAALLAAGTAQLTGLFIGGNRMERPNTSSTGGSFVSGSGNAWTGLAFDNYFYQVDASAGIWISTGHGVGFGYQNNYSPITGAVDKSGLINPAAV